jgi:hypothetical protein
MQYTESKTQHLFYNHKQLRVSANDNGHHQTRHNLQYHQNSKPTVPPKQYTYSTTKTVNPQYHQNSKPTVPPKQLTHSTTKTVNLQNHQNSKR